VKKIPEIGGLEPWDNARNELRQLEEVRRDFRLRRHHKYYMSVTIEYVSAMSSVPVLAKFMCMTHKTAEACADISHVADLSNDRDVEDD